MTVRCSTAGDIQYCTTCMVVSVGVEKGKSPGQSCAA